MILVPPEQEAALLQRLGEHMLLAFGSTSLAILIALPLAFLCDAKPRARAPVLALAGILQTVPSLALLALLLAATHRIGNLPAMIVLVGYALLPILRGTLTGLEAVPPHLVLAARGIGLGQFQRLWRVRLPLALPAIVSSIRVAATIGVGVATVAALIGAGGLGQFINRGLFLNDTRLILLGAVPAALLALVIDFILFAVERVWFDPRFRRAARRSKTMRAGRLAVTLLPLALVAFGIYAAKSTPGRGLITVGSKSFTEQIILGEIAAQAIESAGVPVERRFGLGGSTILHRAVTSGEIDLYPEYTGTAAAAILKRTAPSPEETLPMMRDAYAEQFELRVLGPLGFDNGYILLMREDTADALGIRTLSDLKTKGRDLRAGFDFEFAERADGARGLEGAGIVFRQSVDLDPDTLYPALERQQVDIVSAYATDGRIAGRHFRTIGDDLAFFPPYEAVFVLRDATARRYPQAARALDALSGRIDAAAMQRMNAEVDQAHRDPAAVAHDFLDSVARP